MKDPKLVMQEAFKKNWPKFGNIRIFVEYVKRTSERVDGKIVYTETLRTPSDPIIGSFGDTRFRSDVMLSADVTIESHDKRMSVPTLRLDAECEINDLVYELQSENVWVVKSVSLGASESVWVLHLRPYSGE